MPTIYDAVMRAIGREILLFGIAPLVVALICGIGLVGRISDAEAFVPVYLIGLIFAAAATAMYTVSALFRIVRWLVTNVR